MPDFTDYPTAKAYLDAGRNPFRRTVEGNTYLQKLPMGELSLIYYNTAVVTYYSDGRIILNSGGFRTVTTKKRLNNYTPANIHVYQHDFEWYVRTSADTVLPFVDHMNVGTATLRLDRMRNVSLFGGCGCGCAAPNDASCCAG